MSVSVYLPTVYFLLHYPPLKCKYFLEISSWAADPLSVHIAKRSIYLLLRFLLPSVCWLLQKYILILDIFIEWQNFGPNCLLHVIIRMSYWHHKLDLSNSEFMIPQDCSPSLTLYLKAIPHIDIKLKTQTLSSFSLAILHPINYYIWPAFVLPNIFVPILSSPSLPCFSTLDYEKHPVKLFATRSLPAKCILFTATKLTFSEATVWPFHTWVETSSKTAHLYI